MKSKRHLILCSTLMVLLVFSIQGCNLPQNNPTPDLGLVVAQTQTAIAVAQFLTSTTGPQAIPPADTPVPPPTSAPENPTPTATLPPTPTNTQSAPTVSQAPDCADKAKFLSETIPDGSSFEPGATFTKTWLLQNTGSCTWTPDYSLVLSSGDALGGSSPLLFGQTVPPNATIELNLPLTAPQQPGEYKGTWKLRNPSGKEFGSLWVEIQVGSGGTGNNLNLGPATWTEDFNSGSGGFYLGADSNVNFEKKNNNLVITAFTASGDQWRISSKGYVDNFYLETRFDTGNKCSGEDSYGMIVRAPDQPDSIIDTGYIFGFSCSGKYRVYLMDNGSYVSILNWTNSTAINKGPNQTNTMGILAKGENFQLYANGKLIAEFADYAISTGYFGLFIRAKDTLDFQVIVSEIAYWDLP